MKALAKAAAFTAVLTFVAGCGSESAEPAPPSETFAVSVPPPLVPAMELPENAVDNAVAKLDGLAEELMRKSGIPGMAVAVVHGGKTLYAKGFGVKDVRSGEKVDPDTVFQLASLSKPLSATVVAHQVGVNAIGWTRPSSPSCRGLRCPIRWSPGWSLWAICSRTAPGCPTTQATCSRSLATTAATSSNGCASCRWIRFESPTPTQTSG